MNVAVRTYHPDDAAPLFALFVEAVRIGAATHYTTAQRLAWAPDTDMPPGWPAKLATLDTIVATADGGTVGFMATTQQGYIDLAFVRPRWMGRSVAQALYDRVAERARGGNLIRLTTHASHLARPFFARQGWRVDNSEQINRNGEVLTRFAMSLTLRDPP